MGYPHINIPRILTYVKQPTSFAWKLNLKGPSLQGLSMCHEEHITILPRDPGDLGNSWTFTGFNWGLMELNGIYYDLLGFD